MLMTFFLLNSQAIVPGICLTGHWVFIVNMSLMAPLCSSIIVYKGQFRILPLINTAYVC